MPIINGKYTAPLWQDGVASPPISAQNLQDVCDTAQQNQENITTLNETVEGLSQTAGSTVFTVTLAASGWAEENGLYSQAVALEGLLGNMKVDFSASLDVLAGLPGTIVPVNADGALTAQTTSPPTTDIVIQATYSKVGEGA